MCHCICPEIEVGFRWSVTATQWTFYRRHLERIASVPFTSSLSLYYCVLNGCVWWKKLSDIYFRSERKVWIPRSINSLKMVSKENAT